MGKANFSDEFKRDPVAQITERGYRVAEVSQRLGVSPHSLYMWKRQFGKVASGDASKDAQIRQLKRDMARMTEERDILKRMARPVRKGFVKDGMMVCINVSGLKADTLAKMDIRAVWSS
jgi:transposase-like protein